MAKLSALWNLWVTMGTQKIVFLSLRLAESNSAAYKQTFTDIKVFNFLANFQALVDDPQGTQIIPGLTPLIGEQIQIVY